MQSVRRHLYPAITVEDVGFDAVRVGDHPLYRSAGEAKGPCEVWSTLAAVTDRVQIRPTDRQGQ